MSTNQKRPSNQAELAAKFRLPEIRTESDVDALTHLSDDEKKLGKTLLKKIPDSHGWVVMGSDPELQGFWALMEREYTALLSDGTADFQGIPFGPMHLVSLEVARRSKSDYVYGLFVQLTAVQLKAFNRPADEIGKVGLAYNPDAGVWSDEERRTLKFVGAVLDRTMTDELFAELREAWGPKKVLRMFSWVNFVDMWTRMADMNGMGYSLDMMPPGIAEKGLPLEMIQMVVTNVMGGTRKQVRDYIENTMTNFPGPGR